MRSAANTSPAPVSLAGSNLPPALRQWAEADPTLTLTVRGNADLLTTRLVGFFCSESSPGDAILSTYDLALALRDTDLTFIGGFQSPMEKEFLTFILRGSASVIICPARSITRMRLPTAWRTPLETGRLLLLSCFPDRIRRPTRQTATKRNALVAELATCLLVPHAEPGGKVEQLCQDTLAQHTPVFTLGSAGRLLRLGAMAYRTDELLGMLTAGGQGCRGAPFDRGCKPPAAQEAPSRDKKA